MKYGLLAEFARLSPSRKVLVFALVGGVLGLGYWKILYNSLDEQIEEAKAENKSKVNADKRLGDDLTNYEDLQAHMAKLREQIERNQTALPSDAEVPAFFESLQRKVAASGVEIHRWANHNQEPVESFVRVPVEIELSGTFMQIKRFFASLVQNDLRPLPGQGERTSEDRERIVSIENISLGSPTVKNREIILTAKFTAVMFRQEDRPAPDQPASGQPWRTAIPPPKPAAPPAPTTPSSPPPLPSAAQPAGAKAAVEQAPDNGGARSRNAGAIGDAKPTTGNSRLKGGL
jgi:type IV pilus assembly protein PilO